LHTQSKVASSLLASSTQEVQSVRDKQFTQGNTHTSQSAVPFSKNVSLQVQSGAFSLLAGQEVQFNTVSIQASHLKLQGEQEIISSINPSLQKQVL